MHAVTMVTLQFWFDHKTLNGGRRRPPFPTLRHPRLALQRDDL